MKKKISFLFIIAFVLSINSYGQFSFGVSPGVKFNSAYFGYKINNKIVPFLCFQLLYSTYTFEETGEKFDYDKNEVVSYLVETDFSGIIFLPSLGVKYFFIKKNKIHPYFSLCFSKAFVGGKLKHNGEDDDEFNNVINNLNMWGGELGFGMEYFLDGNISLGAEFGIRHFQIKSQDSFTYEFYNPNTGEFQDSQIEKDIKLNLNPTFSKISLNFYF